MKFAVGLFAALCVCGSAHATPQRLRVDGDTLYFDTSVHYEASSETGIISRDVDEIGQILMEHPEVMRLDVTSDGGEIGAAMVIAHQIDDLELETVARGACYSACVYIFLAGTPRTLAKGGVLGFHATFYNLEKSERRAVWTGKRRSPEFVTYGEYAYDKAINKSLELINFLQYRGVSLSFALNILSYDQSEMWTPSRAEMAAAGVLN